MNSLHSKTLSVFKEYINTSDPCSFLAYNNNTVTKNEKVMTQYALRQQFIRFLKLDSDEYIQFLQGKVPKDEKDKARINNQIEEFKIYHQQLITALENARGICLGMSLCHAASEITGTLPQWEKGIVELMHWEGDKNSLDKELKFPAKLASEEKTSSPESKTAIPKKLPVKQRPNTLRFFIEEALDAILYNQLNLGTKDRSVEQVFKKIFPTGISPKNLLDPDQNVSDELKDIPTKSYFEIVLPEAKGIATIKQRDKLGGHFDKVQLDKMLDKIFDEDRVTIPICLISSTFYEHVCRVSYDKKTFQWMLYDSNDAQSSLATIHFTGTKSQVIERLMAKLGNTLKIEIASVDANPPLQLPALENLVSESSSLIDQFGLSLMAMDSPEHIPELMTQVVLSDHLQEDLANALAKTDYDYWKNFYIERAKAGDRYYFDFEFSSEEIKKLNECDLTTGFQYLIRSSPEALSKLLVMAEYNEKMTDSLCASLCAYDKQKRNGLADVFLFSPQSLPKLFELAKSYYAGEKLRKVLAEGLVVVADETSALAYLFDIAPKHFLDLLDLAESDPAILNAISKNLSLQLGQIIFKIPDALPRLFQLTELKSYGLVFKNSLINALVERPNYIKLLASVSANIIPFIFDLAKSSDLFKKALAKHVSSTEPDRDLKLIELARKNPSFLHQLIKLIDNTSAGHFIKSAISQAIRMYEPELTELAKKNSDVEQFISFMKGLEVTVTSGFFKPIERGGESKEKKVAKSWYESTLSTQLSPHVVAVVDSDKKNDRTQIRLIDTQKNDDIRTIPVRGREKEVSQIANLKNGNLVLCSNQYPYSVQIYDSNTGDFIRDFPIESPAEMVGLKSNQLAISSLFDIKIYDTETGLLLTTFANKKRERIEKMVLDEKGDIIVSYANKVVEVYDGSTFQSQHQFTVSEVATAMAILPDGNLILTSREPTSLFEIYSPDGKLVRQFPKASNTIEALFITVLDSGYIAVSDNYNTGIYDPADGHIVDKLTLPIASACALKSLCEQRMKKTPEPTKWSGLH